MMNHLTTDHIAKTHHGHRHSDHSDGHRQEKSAHQEHQSHNKHHGHMVTEFKKRFYITLAVTIPIVLISPMIQMFLSVDWRFPGDMFVLFGLSSFVFFYGGWPFLMGAKDELIHKIQA
ncbi:hypothetical protein [Paenibacillus sp. 1P07SE]|uniref:hypothetical protein n=1 Tax=Paenibacillus sp. 1P07SE TaxID=3132209 RepID=UPI0039A589F9